MKEFKATRLAPSPTGALHLGHARTFLITWWLARQAGARVYMRMEDLDAGRAKVEAVQQAFEDLRWLGMDWDAFGPEREQEVVVQSHQMRHYLGTLEVLLGKGAVYACICRRADIAANVAGSASAPHAGESQPRYPGTCRGRFGAGLGTVREVVEAVWQATGKGACFRMRVSAGRVGFVDELAGRQEFDVAGEAGDFPVTRFAEVGVNEPHMNTNEHKEKKEDGKAVLRLSPPPPAYQLACVVDDHAMGIDMVIRGDDLLSSTPRQMVVYEALGYGVPRFAHVPLVVGADGKRLAKRHGESRIAQFRGTGVSAERVVGWVAWRSGQVEKLREMTAAEMVGRFEVGKLPKGRVVIGEEDLGWLAGGK
jgi:glutamyl-tRNA synthetase